MSSRSYAARIFDDWWVNRDDSAERRNATVAWAGVNDATLVYGTFLRIYHATWENPRPEVEVSSITLRGQERLGPRLSSAITVEP